MCRNIRTIGAHVSEQSVRCKTKGCSTGSACEHCARSEAADPVQSILNKQTLNIITTE